MNIQLMKKMESQNNRLLTKSIFTLGLILVFIPACCVTANASTETTWYLAEGSTNGFDTFVLVQNPNSTDANITITYTDDDDSTQAQIQTTTVEANSRFTQRINDVSEMNNKTGVSTKVESTNGVGIIVERAMYRYNAAGTEWNLGHCSIGVTTSATDLETVNYWTYQLQNTQPSAAASSGFNMIVMDYATDGTEANKYTATQINTIIQGNVSPICYISIGEAENYRYYWESVWNSSPPSWMGNENPSWSGNYKVRYWDSDWKAIIYTYLDKIIAQGFSGIYLDIIDGYEYWSDSNNGEGFQLTEQEAAEKMITFVKEISEYCRITKAKPNFYIIPQNGSGILAYDSSSSYLNSISGIGVESLWYEGITEKTSTEVTERTIYLDTIVNAGKPVFSIDYVDNGTGYSGQNKTRIDTYRANALAKKYVPYVGISNLALDEINTITNIQPS